MRGYIGVAAVAAAILAFYYLAEYESKGGENAPLYSSLRADPHGSAAFRDLLSESGMPPFVLMEPELPEGEGNVLIQVQWEKDTQTGWEMFFENQEEEDTKDIVDWVKRGNTLVFMCRCNTPALREFGVSIHRRLTAKLIRKIEDSQRRGNPPQKIGGADVSADWENSPGKTLNMREPVTLAGEVGVELIPLASTEEGVVAGQIAYGAGKVVVVGDPSPILNGWIDKGDNLEFVLGLVGDRPVYFDEWVHGLGRGGSIIGLMEKFGLIPALLQALFVLALFLWSGRGVADPPEDLERERVSVIEQIDTLGRLYSRTMKPEQVRERVGQELLTRVHEQLGAHSGDMEHALERAPASRRERLKNIVNEAHGLLHGSGKVSKRELTAALTMSGGMTKEKKDG